MEQSIAIIAAATTLLLELFLHRFQRATLAIANVHTVGNGSRQEIARVQMAMTPDCVGAGWLLEQAMVILTAVLLYFPFSWWGIIVFALIHFCGLFAGIGGVFIPLMPYSWYLTSIERHLESSRLKQVTEHQVPIGATDDLVESMELSRLAQELAEEISNGKISVEAFAARRMMRNRE